MNVYNHVTINLMKRPPTHRSSLAISAVFDPQAKLLTLLSLCSPSFLCTAEHDLSLVLRYLPHKLLAWFTTSCWDTGLRQPMVVLSLCPTTWPTWLNLRRRDRDSFVVSAALAYTDREGRGMITGRLYLRGRPRDGGARVMGLLAEPLAGGDIAIFSSLVFYLL